MAVVFEPGTSCTDVVCGTLAQHFNQYRGILNVIPVPRVEWFEELGTFIERENEATGILHKEYLSKIQSAIVNFVANCK